MTARTETREQIRAYVAPAASPRTIGNSLLAIELRSRVPLARLPLTPQHRETRLLWCRERVDWTVEWRSVIFSDENRFSLYASDERTRVQRKSGEKRLPEGIRPRHTGPTSGFMVWGATCYNSR